MEIEERAALLNERDQLQQAIQRVRELHKPDPEFPDDDRCMYDEDLMPCRTIKALDGEQ